MKKLLIIALCVLGICNVSVFGMVQEIILSELYSIMPLDDPEDDTNGRGPDPTQIRAFIGGNHLSVNADTDMPAYVEVINQETGEVVEPAACNGNDIVICCMQLRTSFFRNNRRTIW